MPPRILIIDHKSIARLAMERALSQEGFLVFASTNGLDAIALATETDPDLIIMNVDLPDLDSDMACQMIRKTPQIRTTPLLVLSGDHVDGFSARCLNQGADGCLVKPVGSQELLAHVHAILRRPKTYLPENAIIRRGRITLRLSERSILCDGKNIQNLTPKEYEILKELTLRSPRVVEKRGLVMKIWGLPLEQLGRRTLDVHILRLRRKLGPTAALYLKTISLIGYQWLESSKP